MLAPAPFVLGALLVALTLTACGGGGKPRSSGAALPSCARASRPLERPGRLIAVPFPAGTVFQRKRENSGGTIYEALVPGVLRSTRDYFKTQLPKHGFTLGEGDSEEHEAETDFSGNGLEGHLKLNDTPACAGVVRLEIALR